MNKQEKVMYDSFKSVDFPTKYSGVDIKKEVVETKSISQDKKEVPTEEPSQQEPEELPEETIETASLMEEDDRYYCPVEDCPKHIEGYATKASLTKHMNNVHPEL